MIKESEVTKTASVVVERLGGSTKFGSTPLGEIPAGVKDRFVRGGVSEDIFQGG